MRSSLVRHPSTTHLPNLKFQIPNFPAVSWTRSSPCAWHLRRRLLHRCQAALDLIQGPRRARQSRQTQPLRQMRSLAFMHSARELRDLPSQYTALVRARPSQGARSSSPKGQSPRATSPLLYPAPWVGVARLVALLCFPVVSPDTRRLTAPPPPTSSPLDRAREHSRHLRPVQPLWPQPRRLGPRPRAR